MTKGENSYILINRDLRMLQVQLSYRDFKEDGWCFAECPELKLVDQGKTKKEAYGNLVSMVLTTLVVAVETGNIDNYLKKLGFKKDRLDIPILKVFRQYTSYKDTIPLTLDAPLPSHISTNSISVETSAG